MGSKWGSFPVRPVTIFWNPKDVFHELSGAIFTRLLKPPFNEEKRAEAGLPPDSTGPLNQKRRTSV